MNASLLRSSSDVFSAMLSGDWRESSHGLSSFSLPSYACTDKLTKLTRKLVSYDLDMDHMSVLVSIQDK